MEIVFDLLSVMREYFKIQMEDNSSVKTAVANISNILAGLLCAF